MSQLSNLIDQAIEISEAMFDPADLLTPHFVAENERGEITVIGVLAGGPALDQMRRDIDLRLRLDRYRRWVFFAEAWAVTYEKGGPGPEPKDHPERMEVIQFDAYDVATNKRVRASRQIHRGVDGARLMPLVISKDRYVDVPAATDAGRVPTGQTP